MRVFVTGATGYVGSAICVALKRRGHDVVGLARSPQAIEKLQRADVHPVAGDMRDAKVLREMTHDADAVIHAAQEMSGENAAIQKTALEAMLSAVDTDHEAFVYTSGAWVYGDTNGKTVDESAPLNPLPIVAWRPAIEQLVLEGAKHRLRTVVIRPGMVYGGTGGVIGGMVDQARAGQLKMVGDGKNFWTCVDVHALADLFVHALERAPSGSIYNASSENVPYGDIVRAAMKAAGKNGEPERISIEDARKAMGPFADALAVDQKTSSAKAERELDWLPGSGPVLKSFPAG